jgi:hypothetical protein
MEANVTAFFEERIIARGSREAVTRAVEQDWPNDQGSVRVFDDATGHPIDLDLYDAGKAAMRAAARAAPPTPAAPVPRGRGRPKLGVVAREVTLLPRQWEWLAAQPGGASASLRRLIDAARKNGAGAADARAVRDAVYRFITEMAGDRPGYEEALRALYRGDTGRFRALIGDWPKDVRDYADGLLASAPKDGSGDCADAKPS